MTDLIFTEKELVQSLKEYIKAEESKLASVKRYCVLPLCVINNGRDSKQTRKPWLV